MLMLLFLLERALLRAVFADSLLILPLLLLMLSAEMTSYRRLWLWDLLWLGLLGAVAVLPFMGSSLDIRAGSPFYCPSLAAPWFMENRFPWKFLYDFGTLPALGVGLSALAAVIASAFKLSLARWRRHFLFLFFALAIGPGLLVNVIFKDHWGRPRPRQIEQFGGQWRYQDALEKGVSGRGKSFPCGHSSMGYYFVAFYFLARRRHRLLAVLSLGSAALYGSLLGVARMAAGAHFLSDVLWSAFFTAGASFLLYYFVFRIPQHEDAGNDTAKGLPHPYWVAAASIVLAAGAISSVLAATPSYTDLRYTFSLPPHRPATLSLNIGRCDTILFFNESTDGRLSVGGEIQGFGWPWSRIYQRASMTTNDAGSRIEISAGNKGYFTEFSGQVRVSVPAGVVTSVIARTDRGDITLKGAARDPLPAFHLRIRQGELVAPAPLRQRFAQIKDGDSIEYRLGSGTEDTP